MVLAELGKSINNALSKLNKATEIDEDLFEDVLKDICKALLSADVNVKYVNKLRKDVRTEF